MPGPRRKLYAEVSPPRLERDAGLPPVERIAYLPELASVQLSGLTQLILVDAKAPVSFFAYPGKKSYLVPEGCEVHQLVAPSEDARASRCGAACVPRSARQAGTPGPEVLQ